MKLSKIERQVIRELQHDIPLVPRPFAEIARRLGVEEAEVIGIVRGLARSGKLRRIAAVLLHRNAGFRANGLTVWKVPERDCDRIGRLIASFPEVTHCYKRKAYRDLPYTIYAMIHARTRSECAAIARKIAAKVGIDDYELLFSTREFKKTSPVYE